jgi:hypothetical protein
LAKAGIKEPVTVVIFEGGRQDSPVEADLVKVRHALLLDNLAKFLASSYIGEIFLLTNYPELAREAALLGVLTEINQQKPADFAFGRELQRIVRARSPKHLFYLGGAGAPLLTTAEIDGICQSLLAQERAVITNNSQSADLVAFTPASLLLQIPPPAMDNTLALDLQAGCGLFRQLAPATLGTVFDLDTPADLLILAVTSLAGPRALQLLKEISLDLTLLRKARAVLLGDYEDVILMGRVGAPVIARMNSNLKVRLRVFSEERGMKALGRMREQKVVSLMAYFLEEVGLEAFFNYIGRVCSCAFIDSRVIFAHRKLDPSDADRFNSDLGRWQQIKDPFVRDFTRAALACPVPVILGGHSLILGGLWALVEDIGPQF